jgi:hypothetical protein
MYNNNQKNVIIILSVFYVLLNIYNKKILSIIIFILGSFSLSFITINVYNSIILSYLLCIIFSISKNFHLLENFEDTHLNKIEENDISDRLLNKYITNTKEKYPKSSFTRQVKLTDLIPSHSELCPDKLNIMKNKADLHDIPIVITNDNFIIDGHYRWKINQNNNKKFVTAIIINTTINKFLQNIKKFKRETNIDELTKFTIDKEKLNRAKKAIKNIIENAKLLNDYQKDLDKINVV